MITRRGAIASLASAAGTQRQTKAQARRRPNFLFLIADDHAGYVLGADGNRQAETPNLDRLAGEGTRFASHFCNSPVCTPSRQSLLTGQMPSMAGVTVLRTPLDASKPTLAKQFQKAGYSTAVFGKMHLNQPSRPGLHGFDYMMTEQDLQKAWAEAGIRKPVDASVRVKPQWRPFRDPARIWLNSDKLPYPRYDEDMKGTFLARKACEYLEEHKDKPFALWTSFHEPHSPFDFPIEDTNRIDAAKFAAPRLGPEDAWQIPMIYRDLSDSDKRGIIASYYTSARFLDKNLGIVLAKLRELNLEEDTLVVYLADHGYSLGQHGRFEKHCGYEPALRVPLIIRWPGRVRRGAVAHMTEHIDVAPTVIDLLGLDPLPIQHGQSLRPYMEGRKPSQVRDHIFSQYLENEEVFVRSEKWKYIFCSGKRKRTDGYLTDNPTPGRYVRLYDRKADPGEFTDVAAKNPAVVREMEELALKRFRATHPDAASEPAGLDRQGAIEWYVRPRDGA